MGLFELVRPAIFTMAPEPAHELSLKGLESGVVRVPPVPQDNRLVQTLAGLTFQNPIGLAAGYDKDARVPDEALALGFGFTEVGTLTPLPQTGNPRPRVFRIVEHKAVINRLGFNNGGHEKALERLKRRGGQSGIVGVNIGANKSSKDFPADYAAGIKAFHGLASYFTANISSPNTPGLRSLQGGQALEKLLEIIFTAMDEAQETDCHSPPVFLKVAPDLEDGEVAEIAEVVCRSRLAALIVSNTTLDRPGTLQGHVHGEEAGGLSGAPLMEPSTRILAKFRNAIGTAKPLIGVGGVTSAKDAIHKMEAGATLVQLYTGLVYKGPHLPGDIVRGLIRHLDETGTKHISDMTGSKTADWV